ncbi:hypothetical protein [Microbacterium aurum]
MELLSQLDGLAGPGKVAVNVTIPSFDGFYTDLIGHPRVARVVALSGGYSRDEANTRRSQPGPDRELQPRSARRPHRAADR